MDDRERKWIKKNRPDLIKNTNCNVLLLSYLQSKDILSSSDVEAISAKAGDLAKADKLYDILQTRAGSFVVLLEALEHVRQTGALAILQNLAGPKWVLDPQRMFLSAGENVLSFLENKKHNTLLLSSFSTKTVTDKILQNVPKSVLLSSGDVLKHGFELKPWIRVIVVHLDEKWSKVLHTLSNYKGLKTIFVSCTDNKLLETIQTKYKGKILNQKESTCWDDLSPCFQLDVANRVNQKCFGIDVSSMLEKLEDKMLLELINNNELFASGIQGVTSYYVNRTIVYKNAISPSIFENQTRDIWIFKNMKKEELVSLKSEFEFDFTSKQIHKSNISCQFLILDFNTDFECICSKTKSTVHLIEKVENNLYWKETRGNMGYVLNCIEEEVVKEFSEAELIETIERNKIVTGNTVIISDSPGMGKSFLLENLGRRLMESYPDRMVILVVLSEFVDRFSAGSNIQIEDILQVLVKMACKNKLSESVFQHILPRIRIELLLDGFDEIKPEKNQIALEILSQITTKMPKIRKWVTTRPHFKQQLEKHCSTIAYQIAPFNEQTQQEFLNSFWRHSFATSQASQQNVSDNEIQRLNPNLLNKFTKHILRDIKNCLSQRDTDIVGIPLQCMLIAQALQEDAFRCSKSNNCNNVDALEFCLPISSISEMYRLFVSTKINYYLMRTQNSKIDLEALEIVHVYYSLLLLFPHQATKFNFQDKLKSIKSDDYLAVGILQAGSLHDSPRFIHRTFAEYFISEFCIKQMQESTSSSYFLNFLFETVMNTKFTEVLVPYVYSFNSFCFREKTVCHFLNSSIETVIKSSSLCNLIEKLDTVYRIPLKVHQISHASAVDNFENIFSFLAVTNAFHCHQTHLVLDKEFLHIVVFKSALGFIKVCFKLYDSLQLKTCYQLDDVNTYVLSENLKHMVVNVWNIYDASTGRLDSLLHTAVIRGDFSIALFFIQHTGFINVLKDCPLDFQNLIRYSVSYTKMESIDHIEDRIAIIKKLIELNKEFVCFKKDGLPISLCNKAHVRLLEELLLRGADPLSEDENKDTLWHVVADRPTCSDFYRLLTGITCCTTTHKIVNAKNNESDTVLQVLVRSCNPEEKTLELLKKCGADFNTRNVFGFTPIFTAVSAFRNPKTIPLLLIHGADIMSINSNGLPIFHYAASVGNVNALCELVNIVLEKNTKNFLSWRDRNGKIPLEYAQSQAPGQFDYYKQLCVDFLLSYHSVSDLSGEEDLLARVTDLSTTDIFESWEFFRVVSSNDDGPKDMFSLIIFYSEEQKYHSVQFKCSEKHVTIYQKGDKKIKIERQVNIKGLTSLLESILVLSNFLKFSLGFLKILLSDASSDADGDLMACWILNQHLSDDLVVAHLEWCISKGTDINSWSLDGSPLINEIIKIASSTKPLNFLFEQGAKADRTDSGHNNALHVLFEYSKFGFYEAASSLIKNGVDVLKCNVNGDTPIMVLFKSRRKFDFESTYFLLQSAGAICNSKIASLAINWLSTKVKIDDKIISTLKYLISKGGNLLWKKKNDDLCSLDIIFIEKGKDIADSLMQTQEEHKRRTKIISAQISCPSALQLLKKTFRSFASEYELTNTKLIEMNIDANAAVSNFSYDFVDLDNILNEVYLNDMSDIVIIFAYLITLGSLKELIFVSEWCKERDSSFNLKKLQLRISKGFNWHLLFYTVAMGNFQYLQHLIENEGFKNLLFKDRYESLLHYCLHLMHCKGIINYLSNINPNLLNGKRNNKTLFEAEYLTPHAFVALIRAGANIDDFSILDSNIFNCTPDGISLMHTLPHVVDSNKYHKFILEIHSKNLLPTLFLETGAVNGQLHEAISCLELKYETLKLLVDSGVDINIQAKNGFTPLMIAVKRKQSLDSIQILINMGADMSIKALKKDPYEQTILHYMIQHYFQDSATLVFFLKFCRKENLMRHFKASDKDGNTALHYAFQYLHITADMIPLLFSDGSFFGLTNKNHQTILHYATEYLDLPAYETLVSLLKNNNLLSIYNESDVIGNTPLHCLAKISAKSECISKYLIGEQEIDFNLTNTFDETFLHCLVTDNVNKATFESLLSGGVNLYTQNTDGKTFVHTFIDNSASQDVHTLFVYLVDHGLTELLLKETSDGKLFTSIEYGILKKKDLPKHIKIS